MLASLESETIFKKAFTDKTVFTCFVRDILNINIDVDKIETEKKFEFKVGQIDICYDIYAESKDQRFVIEIQRVDYDYHFDRFLHYHLAAILEQQRHSQAYTINKTVYTIVVLTAPYRINQRTGMPIADEVLISSVNPRNLKNTELEIYGHQLIFLNPHYRGKDTPQNYRDWLDLIYDSINNPTDFKLNLENEGIKKTVELIDYEKLDPATMTEMKIMNERKALYHVIEESAVNKGKKLGIDEGKKLGINQVAASMLKKGMPDDLIMEMTGLSKEEMEGLK